MLCILLLSCIAISPTPTQALNDNLDPMFNPAIGFGAEVSAVLIQPDNKTLISGSFVQVADQARNHIARLNADGSLDISFKPVMPWRFGSMALQADGKIIVSGSSLSPDGQNSVHVIRLNTDGTLDTSFQDSNVKANTIIVQADGKIIIGGQFSSIAGQARQAIARLNADGSLDTSFDAGLNAGSSVKALALQSNGTIIIGGDFSTIAGQARPNLARLNIDGSLDSAFAPNSINSVNVIARQPDDSLLVGANFGMTWLNADGSARNTFTPQFGPDSCMGVLALAVQNDAKVVLSGLFFNLFDATYARTIRLNADGSLDTSFEIDPKSSVFSKVLAMAKQSTGEIVLGGSFSTKAGQPRFGLARLLTDGSLDTNFSISTNVAGEVKALALQADGKILLGGFFSTVAGLPYAGIARINANGKLDSSFQATIDGEVVAIAEQSDGKILIAGGFGHVAGSHRQCIARLNADGTLDAAFYPIFQYSGCVYALALQPDGKMIIGGSFTSIQAQDRYHLARLNADGTLDTTFNPNITPYSINKINVIKLLPDGKILVAGMLTEMLARTAPGIIRLNSDGSRDTSFDATNAVNDTVNALDIQSDGKIVVGDSKDSGYDYIIPAGRILRLDSAGSLDPSFTILDTDKVVRAIAHQSDDTLVVGGSFTQVAKQARTGIVRLLNTGTIDASFTIELATQKTGYVPETYALLTQPDGSLLLGGTFFQVSGQTRLGLARLGITPLGEHYTVYLPKVMY